MTSRSGLPETVRVGYLDYAIVAWNPIHARDAHRYGETAHLSQEIRVDFDHGKHELINTLLHEIAHAIWRCYGLEDEDKEERTILVLTNGWVQVWRDNPAILAWVSEQLK